MHQITVLKSNVMMPEGKKYQVCELGYKTEDGKVKGMRIFGFGEMKPVFDVAAKAAAGDVLNAQFRQNEKGYWEFASLASSDKVQTVISEGNKAPARGNWETSEERAARQVMIVRQSSLSNAVAFFEAAKLKPSVADVITVASEFEDYVLGKATEAEVQ